MLLTSCRKNGKIETRTDLHISVYLHLCLYTRAQEGTAAAEQAGAVIQREQESWLGTLQSSAQLVSPPPFPHPITQCRKRIKL